MEASGLSIRVLSLQAASAANQIHSRLVVFVLNYFVKLNVCYTAAEQVIRLCFLIIFSQF